MKKKTDYEQLRDDARKFYIENPDTTSTELATKFARSKRWARARIKETEVDENRLQDDNQLHSTVDDSYLSDDKQLHTTVDTEANTVIGESKSVDGNDSLPVETVVDQTSTIDDHQPRQLVVERQASVATEQSLNSESSHSSTLDGDEETFTEKPKTNLKEVAREKLNDDNKDWPFEPIPTDQYLPPYNMRAENIALGMRKELAEKQESENDRTWLALASQLSATVVAVIAGIASYVHIVSVALATGEDKFVAHLIPFSLDGLIVVATFAMLLDKKRGFKPRRVARIALIVGIVGTLCANVASADPAIMPRQAIAVIPALAFLLSFEVLVSRPSKRA